MVSLSSLPYMIFISKSMAVCNCQFEKNPGNLSKEEVFLAYPSNYRYKFSMVHSQVEETAVSNFPHI